MQYAEATTVITLDFLRLPLIALVGVLLYSEQFELSLLFGGLLMLIGNIVSLKQPAYNKSINYAPSAPDAQKARSGY
jgi:drug/metabolite transporter (DMT)-like permease